MTQSKGTAEEWAKRFQAHPAYQKIYRPAAGGTGT